MANLRPTATAGAGKLPGDLLKRIAGASATGGGTPIRDGRYRFLVKKVLLEPKYKGTCFIAELRVLTAAVQVEGVKPNAVGSDCGYVVNFDGGGRESAPSNVKAFLLALYGMTEDEVNEDEFVDDIQYVVGPDQPAAGMVIDVETFRKPIKSKPGQEFVAMGWKRVEQTAEEIAKQRAELGLKPLPKAA